MNAEALLQMIVGLVGPGGVLIATGLALLWVITDTIIYLTPSQADDALKASLLARFPVIASILEALKVLYSPLKKK